MALRTINYLYKKIHAVFGKKLPINSLVHLTLSLISSGNSGSANGHKMTSTSIMSGSQEMDQS